jgi:putrescine transport system substrate-binding protein
MSSSALRAMGWLLLACLLVAAHPARAQERSKVLNLYSWTDYFPKSLRDQFQAQTGIRVNMAVFDSPDTVETVLSVGHSGYDLVIVNAAPHLGREAPKGFFRKLDKARIPNSKNADAQVMQVLQSMDPGNQYAVPWMWGTVGIMYDRDKVRSLLPNPPVNPLDLIFKKELAAKVTGCGISILDNWQDVMPMVARYLGQPDLSTDTAALDAVVAKLLEAKPFLRRIASSGYFEQLANGELCLALGYSGDAMIARRMVREAQGKRVVEYAFPRERVPLFIDAIAIPADAPNAQAAQAFIDFIMRPDVSAAVVRDIGFGAGNGAAVALLEPAVRNNPAVFPPPEVRARFSLGRLYTPLETRIFNRAWQRFKTGI